MFFEIFFAFWKKSIDKMIFCGIIRVQKFQIQKNEVVKMNATFNNNFNSAAHKSTVTSRTIGIIDIIEEVFFAVISFLYTLIHNEAFIVVSKICTFFACFAGLLAVVGCINSGKLSFLAGYIIAIALLAIVVTMFRKKSGE